MGESIDDALFLRRAVDKAQLMLCWRFPALYNIGSHHAQHVPCPTFVYHL